MTSFLVVASAMSAKLDARGNKVRQREGETDKGENVRWKKEMRRYGGAQTERERVDDTETGRFVGRWAGGVY